LSAANRATHDGVGLGRKPADQPHSHLRVVSVGDPPQLVPTRLPNPPKPSRLLVTQRCLGQASKMVQGPNNKHEHRSRMIVSLPRRRLQPIEPNAELRGKVHVHVPTMPSKPYAMQDIPRLHTKINREVGRSDNA